MRYYSTQRPLGPGCYPKMDLPGFENRVLDIHNFDERTYCPEIGCEAWGYIEYEKPVSLGDLMAWELVPVRKLSTDRGEDNSVSAEEGMR